MVQPSRRQLLATLSAGGGALLTGCTGGPDELTPTDSNTPTETAQTAPEFPGDTTTDACPPFEAADTVVCYDAVDPAAMPLVLVPETQTVQPGQPAAFTLRNRSGQRFETNFYHWRLYKRAGGDWYYIMPQSWPEPLTPLAAGEDHTWTLTVETGRVSDGAPIESVKGTESLRTNGLGGGHYAFGTDGWFVAGSYEEPIVLMTSFELQADPLQLTPTAAIAGTEWDGKTLIARSTRGEATDNEDERDVFLLERTDDTDPKQVIMEQVVRDNQLRDAIALSREYDAERVRLEEYSRSVPPFGVDGARSYEFKGERYRVTTNAGISA